MSIGDFATCQAPGILCIVRETSSLEALVTELLACRLVSRTITRMLPYDTWVPDIARMVTHVTDELNKGPGQRCLRVWARPRALEKQICALLGPQTLSTAGFTDSLFVSSVTCKSGDLATLQESLGDDSKSLDMKESNESSITALRFSLLQRSVIDVPAWTALRKNDSSSSRMYQRILEAAIRWPHRFKDKRSVCIWSDAAEGSQWMETFADEFLSRGAAISELHFACQEGTPIASSFTLQCLRKQGDEDASGVSVLLVERSWIGFGGTDAFSELEQVVTLGTQSGALASSGMVVVKLRCPRTVKAVDAWYRDTARWFREKLGAEHVELLHLLADKEQERTAVLNWEKSLLPNAVSFARAS